MGMGQNQTTKIPRGLAIFFHLAGFHVGYRFLTHAQVGSFVAELTAAVKRRDLFVAIGGCGLLVSWELNGRLVAALSGCMQLESARFVDHGTDADDAALQSRWLHRIRRFVVLFQLLGLTSPSAVLPHKVLFCRTIREASTEKEDLLSSPSNPSRAVFPLHVSTRLQRLLCQARQA